MLVEEHNLSVAWAKVFLTVLKENEVSPVVVAVRDIGDSGPAEIPGVRDALDELLEGDGKGLSCNTVANTIFPSIWNPHADRQELYERYNRILPKLRKDQRNKYGLYFQRLTSYGANRRRKWRSQSTGTYHPDMAKRVTIGVQPYRLDCSTLIRTILTNRCVDFRACNRSPSLLVARVGYP